LVFAAQSPYPGGQNIVSQDVVCNSPKISQKILENARMREMQEMQEMQEND
jgi:hypothetical protein